MNWGSIPDWVAAVGTVGSLFIALWLIKRELDDRKQRDAEKESEQARRVSAWSQRLTDKYVLSAKNTGEEPVFDVVLFCYLSLDDPRIREDYLRARAAAEHPQEEIDYNEPLEVRSVNEWKCGILPPGETFSFKFNREDVEGGYQGIPDVEMQFTDASGRHWQRDTSGKLARIAARTPHGSGL